MQTLAIPKRERIYAIAFAPDGRDLAAVCGDNTLRIWDTITGELRRTVVIDEAVGGNDLHYLDSNRVVYSGMNLRRWDMTTDVWEEIDSQRSWGGRQLAVAANGEFAAAASQFGWTGFNDPRPGVDLYETAGWSTLPEMANTASATGGVAFSPDGQHLATAHTVLVGEKQRSIGHGFGSYPVNDYDYVVHIRKVPSGRIVRTIGGWRQAVRKLAFSPDGSVLAGTAGPRLRACHVATDRELAMHARGPKHFQGLSFTADGRFLATVSNDTTVRLWETSTWSERTTFTWDVGRLLNIAIAPDGLRAAAGSDKGRVVIWDLDV